MIQSVKVIDYLSKPHIIDFANEVIEKQGYDLSKLQQIKLLPLYGKVYEYKGFCWFPTEKREKYLISVSVNRIGRRHNSTVEVRRKRPKNRPGRKSFQYLDQAVSFTKNEIIVFVLGHEMFHFLRDTDQVPGQNTERQANAFGLTWVNMYRSRNK